MIRLVTNKDINREKWNFAIQSSQLPLASSMAWFLDIVNPQWIALVKDNYQAVMPLPHVTNFFFTFLNQPPFIAQLGVFETSKNNSSVDEWIAIIENKFKRYNFNLNTTNIISSVNNHDLLKNCELNLSKDYNEIYTYYSKNARRNLKKVTTDKIYKIDINTFIDLKLKYLNYLNPFWYKKVLPRLISAFDINNINCYMIGTGNPINGAMIFYLFKGRLTYLSGVSSPMGKKQRSMFLLMDAIIQQFSNQNIILDFRGGNMEGTRRFFTGFGAKIHTYPNLKNR